MFRLKVDLLKDNIWKALIFFALPMLVANVFQQLYNTMDTMIVGNTLGDVSLAAIGATGAIYELLVGFALGVGNGLSIVAARSYGAHNEDLLKKSVAGSIVIGIGMTIVIMFISLFLLYPLLELLQTPIDIIDESYSYIFIVTIFVGVMFAYNLLAGLLRAIGNSVMPLAFLIVSSLINVVLDIVFITQFHMGITGAAVATVIAQGISAVLCFIYIFKKAPILLPKKEHFHIEKSLYKELMGQGFSMGFMLCIVSIGTVILQSAINGLGYLTIAGHVAARKLSAFCSMPATSLCMAISTFVSQNKGANQRDRIKEGVRCSHIIACVCGVGMTIVLFFIAPLLVRVISGSSHPTVIDNGVMYLRINAPFYAVLGILLNLRNSLQGLGMKVVPLISSVIECIGKMIFVAIFIPLLGYFGVIICEPVIWCVMTLQLAWSFYHNSYIQGKSDS